MKKIKYGEWNLISDSDFGIECGKKVITNKYEVKEKIKDTKRSLVMVLEMGEEKYILKEFRSEIIIPQRKFKTLLKKGEALTTLINCNEVYENGLVETVKPIVAIVKKKIFMQKSFLLMEYIEGEKLKTIEDVEKVIEITKKIHKLGRIHGDLNTSNFIKTNSGIKIIDSQLKKEHFFWFNRIKDILILKEDLLVLELKMDIDSYFNYTTKGLEYTITSFLRRLKKLKFVENFREKKKKLREKGWKI